MYRSYPDKNQNTKFIKTDSNEIVAVVGYCVPVTPLYDCFKTIDGKIIF